MFEPSALPFGFAALEGVISGETMELHYELYEGYTSRLNYALEEIGLQNVKDIFKLLDPNDPYDVTLGCDRSLESDAEEIFEDLLFNAGGYLNHTLFWRWLSPDGGGEPEGPLRAHMLRAFGSLDGFRAHFEDNALSIHGSGWIWLVLRGRRLQVVLTDKQETPWSSGCYPILGLDVWEHAYYLDVGPDRAEYVSSWWEVCNWDEAEAIYEQLLK